MAIAAYAFDTYDAIKRLQSSGFETEQAEGVVEILNKALEKSAEDLATKGDLKEVETSLRSDLKEVETSLNAKIDKVETSLNAKIDKVEAVLSAKLDILKWIGGVIAVAAVTSAVKYVFFNA